MRQWMVVQLCHSRLVLIVRELKYSTDLLYALRTLCSQCFSELFLIKHHQTFYITTYLILELLTLIWLVNIWGIMTELSRVD